MIDWRWEYDGWVLVVAILCACSCALLGNFLVLRRMSMMGDAISHAVLPGIAGGFLAVAGLQHSETLASWWPGLADAIQSIDPRHPVAMLGGAVICGLLTALFTEWVAGFGKVNEGASMGVVFTTLFAIGLVLIKQAEDSHVDLDPSCVLYGLLEFAPAHRWNVLGMSVPRSAVLLGITFLLNLAFVVGLFKELRISSFDPNLATTMGINARWMHYALMTMVAITTVASFDSVGSIIVIAMLIVPAATAHLLTHRLGAMVLVSLLAASLAATGGTVSGVVLDVPVAGMVGTISGVLFALVLLFAPHRGLAVVAFQRWRANRRVLREDVLGFLYRLQESARAMSGPETVQHLSRALLVKEREVRSALRQLARRELVQTREGCPRLTDEGERLARTLVRSHRLWENYLVQTVGVEPDHVHRSAMKLEHVTSTGMQKELARDTAGRSIDPHGQSIPPGSDEQARERQDV